MAHIEKINQKDFLKYCTVIKSWIHLFSFSIESI